MRDGLAISFILDHRNLERGEVDVFILAYVDAKCYLV
jgi:hypothetical protein